MFRGKLQRGICATAMAAALAAIGCALPVAAADQVPANLAQAIIPNQGRFPAPRYQQQAQPPYALTGQQQDHWTSVGRFVNVGNARVFVAGMR